MKRPIDNNKIPTILDRDDSEGGPKIVKTYRVDPHVFKVAESRCQKTHGCGVSSLVQDLLVAYFNIKPDDHA